MKAVQIPGLYRFNIAPAMKRDHSRFDNVAYHRATYRKGNPYANALIDDALALCGHPHYKLSFRNWGMPAIEFLRLFVNGGK